MSNKNQSKRVVVDFTTINPKLKLIVGKVLHNRASLPLEEHVHPTTIEISYFINGKQVYMVEGEAHNIEGNDVFITFPGEKHGSGDYQKDKSSLYYVQMDTELFNVLGLEFGKGQELLNKLLQIEKRCFKASKKIYKLLERIFIEGQSPTEFSDIIIRNYISEFIIELINGEEKYNNDLKDSIKVATDYIENHLEESIEIKELANLMNLSQGRFKIFFKEVMGIPPKEYVLRRKIKVAKELLESTDKSITEIAYSLGFSSSQYFTTVFKRFNIQSPREYRDSKIINER